MSTTDGVAKIHRSFNPNRLLFLFLSSILVFTIAVLLLTTNREAKVWKISSPQGVVQAYLNAMTSGEIDAAATYLSKNGKCDIVDLDRVYINPDMRIYLSSSKINSSVATVIVRAEIPSGGPLGESSSELHSLRLSNLNGKWLIEGIPWPLYDCGVIEK